MQILLRLSASGTVFQNALKLVKDHWITNRICKSPFQTIHVRTNLLYEIRSRSVDQEGLKLAISNQMFDQTAASVTEEEYSEDYQEYSSYLREVLKI